LARLSKNERPLTALRIGTNVIQKLKGRNPLRRWWARQRLAATYASADLVIGVSDGACQAMRELIGARETPHIARIYNPIDLGAFRRMAAEPVAHPWFLDKTRPLVLSAGRLVRAKDFPTLLHAFRRVQERTNSRLVILGEGRQRAKLERMSRQLGLAEAVDLPGFSPNPFAYMARADLFVLSSLYEGFGNVLAEAMAVGTPCVATDCRSGPREILADGRYGHLVRPGNAEALADAILESLARPPRPDLLVEALHRFDRDAAVGAYQRALGLAPENHWHGIP
jgi:glycosyltransferase involved in cell wall biosynthesis